MANATEKEDEKEKESRKAIAAIGMIKNGVMTVTTAMTERKTITTTEAPRNSGKK